MDTFFISLCQFLRALWISDSNSIHKIVERRYSTLFCKKWVAADTGFVLLFIQNCLTWPLTGGTQPNITIACSHICPSTWNNKKNRDESLREALWTGANAGCRDRGTDFRLLFKLLTCYEMQTSQRCALGNMNRWIRHQRFSDFCPNCSQSDLLLIIMLLVSVTNDFQLWGLVPESLQIMRWVYLVKSLNPLFLIFIQDAELPPNMNNCLHTVYVSALSLRLGIFQFPGTGRYARSFPWPTSWHNLSSCQNFTFKTNYRASFMHKPLKS